MSTKPANIKSRRVRRKLALTDERFKRLIGVKKATFFKMLEILQEDFDERHKKGGKPPWLQVEDKLLFTLEYYREYRTMDHLAEEYDTVKSNIHKSIVWVENTLIREGTFNLPGKNCLVDEDEKPETILIDVTESPIERPQKNSENTTPARKNAIPSSRN
jgi:hypothetical protein